MNHFITISPPSFVPRCWRAWSKSPVPHVPRAATWLTLFWMGPTALCWVERRQRETTLWKQCAHSTWYMRPLLMHFTKQKHFFFFKLYIFINIVYVLIFITMIFIVTVGSESKESLRTILAADKWFWVMSSRMALLSSLLTLLHAARIPLACSAFSAFLLFAQCRTLSECWVTHAVQRERDAHAEPS